jgi:hypothetical protein
MSAPEVKEWSVGLEGILAKEGEEAQSLFWLHNKAAREAQRRNDYINIPSIILQTVTGFMSATNGAVPPLALGAISIFTGILSTLLSYYRFSARAEGHRVVSQLYLKIYKNIEIELALVPEQRIDPSKLLADVRDKLARISEVAPDIPDSVIKMYKAEFKENTTAKPIIANGLDKIEIYREEIAIVSPRPKVEIRRVEF